MCIIGVGVQGKIKIGLQGFWIKYRGMGALKIFLSLPYTFKLILYWERAHDGVLTVTQQ